MTANTTTVLPDARALVAQFGRQVRHCYEFSTGLEISGKAALDLFHAINTVLATPTAPDARALIQDLLWVIDRSHGHRHVEAAERARAFLAISAGKAECSEHDAYRLRLIAEADCGCRIPAPFDEVADHLAAIAFDEGVKRCRATQPAPDAAVPAGLPERFEAWWASYRHRNLNLVGYAVKKQIAFDAFEAAAAPKVASEGADREAIANLHALQHDTAANATKPVWGGSVIQWAADEIRVMRASDTGAGLRPMLQEAHDTLHECTAVLHANDCRKVAAVMERIRHVLAAPTDATDGAQ